MDTKTQAIKGALAALTQNATFPADIALAVKILKEADAAPADPVAAAAPKLLAALEGLCGLAQYRGGHLDEYKAAVAEALAVIAEAKGV